MNSIFANRLKAIRLRRGWSQAALAEFLGIPASRIGNWEAGRNGPGPKSVGQIAESLGVSVDFLTVENAAIPELPEASPARTVATAREPSPPFTPRTDRVMHRLAELTDLEYARTEPAILGIIEAVVGARRQPAPTDAGFLKAAAQSRAQMEKDLRDQMGLRGNLVPPKPAANRPATPNSGQDSSLRPPQDPSPRQ